MDLNSFSSGIEKPIYDNIEELFDAAQLNSSERAIFSKFKAYCEYWLLRSKKPYSRSYDNKPNFIQDLARVLINLQSQRVIGPKDHYVKEMFSDKKVHKIIETKTGFRSTKNSNKVFNTYFELEIMSFFLENGFNIELSVARSSGQKIPEFVATKNEMRLNIEAKKLDVENIKDNIFGDKFINGIDHKQTDDELKKGYERIFGAFQRNYENALEKYYMIPDNEYFVLFISSYYKIALMGQQTINYFNNLQTEWKDEKYGNFVGVILPDSEKTYYIKNKICDLEITDYVSKIKDFHCYFPTVLENHI
ncbi:MAG: hypothetical protein JEZ06_21045 [Anaerolineaceae bacterium]|nr:hypothetical protein [Anaerolineaceae bacterium]